MKVKIIGLIVGFTMALSLGVTLFGAVSNAANQEASGMDPTRLAASTNSDGAGESNGESAVHQAFFYVCPFH